MENKKTNDPIKTDLTGLYPGELRELTASLGEQPFRAEQLYGWLCNGAERFADMTNLPKSFIEKLEKTAFIPFVSTEKKLVSKTDGTVKYLFSFADGECVESVLMRYKHGNTICVSTQAGCRMGCAFCASAKNGLSRSLTASEMLLQVTAAQKDCGERISNIVLMGIGEPLDNYDETIRFIRLANLHKGLNVGFRHFSLSTCGLIEKFDMLAMENIPLTLSISLHAADDEKRKQIMPVANKYTVRELINACNGYVEKTKRRISFEYALIKDFNDSAEDAHRLGKLLKGLLCHVNLIPVNPVREKDLKKYGKIFEKPEKLSEYVFTETLNSYKINTTTRRRLGGDIEASCGQLRAGRL